MVTERSSAETTGPVVESVHPAELVVEVANQAGRVSGVVRGVDATSLYIETDEAPWPDQTSLHLRLRNSALPRDAKRFSGRVICCQRGMGQIAGYTVWIGRDQIDKLASVLAPPAMQPPVFFVYHRVAEHRNLENALVLARRSVVRFRRFDEKVIEAAQSYSAVVWVASDRPLPAVRRICDLMSERAADRLVLVSRGEVLDEAAKRICANRKTSMIDGRWRRRERLIERTFELSPPSQMRGGATAWLRNKGVPTPCKVVQVGPLGAQLHVSRSLATGEPMELRVQAADGRCDVLPMRTRRVADGYVVEAAFVDQPCPIWRNILRMIRPSAGGLPRKVRSAPRYRLPRLLKLKARVQAVGECRVDYLQVQDVSLTGFATRAPTGFDPHFLPGVRVDVRLLWKGGGLRAPARYVRPAPNESDDTLCFEFDLEEMSTSDTKALRRLLFDVQRRNMAMVAS